MFTLVGIVQIVQKSVQVILICSSRIIRKNFLFSLLFKYGKDVKYT